MIAKRIIPLFLLKGKRLVKGSTFKDFKDVGDPVSQAMIYDAQGADEVFIVDVTASAKGKVIDGNLIKEMISKCRLPITVGGGIKSVKNARDCFHSGADKIVVNTNATQNAVLVKQLVEEFGSQSVVVSIDVKTNDKSDYNVYAFSGKQKTKLGLKDYLREILGYGAGEIILTSIDNEGELSGLDIDLYKQYREIITVPLIGSGGAGCYDDLVDLFNKTDCDGCAIGKMLFLRDYDIVRIKSYLKGKCVLTRQS